MNTLYAQWTYKVNYRGIFPIVNKEKRGRSDLHKKRARRCVALNEKEKMK